MLELLFLRWVFMEMAVPRWPGPGMYMVALHDVVGGCKLCVQTNLSSTSTQISPTNTP
jgi:hypothetical protein